MPRAILAMRRYPATMLLAIVLFLATLIMTASSLGTVGNGGGEDGDGGSGIGGTGKSGEFGGSGFGGTGGPSPFFTSADDTIQQDNDTRTQIADPVIAEVKTELAQTLEQKSLPQEAPGTRLSVDDKAPETLAKESDERLTLQFAEAPAQAQLPESRQASPAGIAGTEARTPIIETATPVVEQHALVTIETAEQATPDLENAAVEPSAIPAEPMTVAHESEEEVSQENIARDNMPERIQRPDLPPFQRIRPVERPSLLPSRVQPMRI